MTAVWCSNLTLRSVLTEVRFHDSGCCDGYTRLMCYTSRTFDGYICPISFLETP